jgi:hypothetical protein
MRSSLTSILALGLCAVALVHTGTGTLSAQEERVSFVDVTEEAGIDFVHFNGAGGSKYDVETMCPGCALFDYDGDGDLDIYLLNGAPLPGSTAEDVPRNRLYRNDGDWHFTDVSLESGAGDPGYGLGCAVGDYDNDGDTDLYVTNYGPNVLYRNEGDGTFVDITEQAGVGDPRWTTTGMFFDYDVDGDLDLYVVNYIHFRLDEKRDCYLPGTDVLGYCHPDIHPGLPDVLYRNEGDGTFTDVTEETGLYRPGARGLGVIGTDYDNDDDLDIYVANDSMENYLFSNLGNGTYEEIALLTGASLNEMGHAEASMGVDMADVDGNGYLDFLMGHLSAETNTLYMNNGDGTFTDGTVRAGMGASTLHAVTFGLVFFDADNDGDPDAFCANGHVMDNIEIISDVITYKQTNFLFENLGGGQFEEASGRFGPGLAIRKASRGVVAGDIDNDGDLDLIVSNVADRTDLLRNEGANLNNWLAVELAGGTGTPRVDQGAESGQSPASNRQGVGARVIVTSGDLRQMNDVHLAVSYQSARGNRLHFGLGKRDRVDSVEVRWPSGIVDRVENVKPNRLVVIIEGEGLVDRKPRPVHRSLGEGGRGGSE